MAVTYFCNYTLKDGKGREFIGELYEKGVVDKVRAENGCIRYDYYFPYENDTEVLLIEVWESEAHQQIHVTQPHIATLKEIKEKYVINTTIEKVN